MMRRKLLIGEERILYAEQKRRLAVPYGMCALSFPSIPIIHDGTGRPLGQHCRNELMAIEPLPSQRHEQIATTNGPRIRADAANPPLGGWRGVARQHLHAADFTQLSYRKKRHLLVASLG